MRMHAPTAENGDLEFRYHAIARVATRRRSHRERAMRVSSDFTVIDAAEWMAGSQRGTTRLPFAVRTPRAGGKASLGSPQATMRSPPW